MLKFIHAATSDRGRKRVANEDRWAADPDLNLYLVADGMGGRSAGAYAAKQIAERLPAMVRTRFPYPLDKFRVAVEVGLASVLQELSEQIREDAAPDPALQGLGATVVLAWLLPDQALIAHLGDSRAYLHREESLEQLTQDHTFAEEMRHQDLLTDEQAEEHPTRNVLTQSIGMDGDPEPDSQIISLLPGDRLLLCSDGLTNEISDEQIEQLLIEHREPAAATEALIREAVHHGGRDNVTALVIAAEESN